MVLRVVTEKVVGQANPDRMPNMASPAIELISVLITT
jgi:hypothetical protein